MYAKKNKKPMYGKGGVTKYQNGGQGPDLESVMAYADALSNDGGGRFQKDLYDYLQILNRESREFNDEFSQRARDLYNDHFFPTAESASRAVTPESKRDASGIDRERVNKFYRDLFQSALSEDGHLAEVILDQANRREQRLLKNAVNREISDFKNSPEGKEAAQMAGPMMSLVNQYSKGGTVKYRSGGMMPKYPGGGMMPRKRGMMYQNGGPVTSLLRNLEMAPEGMDESGEEFIAMQADPTRDSMRAYRSALYKDEDVAEALDGKYNVRDVKFRPFNERQEDMFGGPGAIPRMPSEFDFQASVPRDVLEDDEKRRAYMNTPEFKERQAEGRRAYELAMKRFGVEKQRFLDLMKGRGVDTDRFNENFFRFDAPGRGSKDYDRFVVR